MHTIHATPSIKRAPAIALIGCGASAASFYLPALTRHRAVREQLILVDSDPARARQFASRFNVRHYVQDYRTALGQVDGAILAVPHQLQFALCTDLISNGIHVLCDRPLARTGQEVQDLVVQAQNAGVTVSTNYVRRLFPAYAKVKELLASSAIGRPVSIRFLESGEYAGPAASGTGGAIPSASASGTIAPSASASGTLQSSSAGVAPPLQNANSAPKGVLLELGAHVLDAICWWLDARPRLVSCHGDAYGGSEATARVVLEHEGCSIEVRLSWLSRLPNCYTVEGGKATIEGQVHGLQDLTLLSRGGGRQALRAKAKEKHLCALMEKLISNFLHVLQGSARPLVPLHEVINAVDLMAECYSHMARFNMSWNAAWENGDVKWKKDIGDRGGRVDRWAHCGGAGPQLSREPTCRHQ